MLAGARTPAPQIGPTCVNSNGICSNSLLLLLLHVVATATAVAVVVAVARVVVVVILMLLLLLLLLLWLQWLSLLPVRLLVITGRDISKQLQHAAATSATLTGTRKLSLAYCLEVKPSCLHINSTTIAQLYPVPFPKWWQWWLSVHWQLFPGKNGRFRLLLPLC